MLDGCHTDYALLLYMVDASAAMCTCRAGKTRDAPFWSELLGFRRLRLDRIILMYWPSGMSCSVMTDRHMYMYKETTPVSNDPPANLIANWEDEPSIFSGQPDQHLAHDDLLT